MSALDLLAELEGVDKPDGDPGLVRQAAQRLAGLADGLERAAATLEQGVGQALGGWQGQASERFAAKAGELAGPVRQAAGVLRQAAGAANLYAARLEAAQARWQQVRGGAVVGRALKLPELWDPDIRRAVAEAEAAATDAQAAAVQLAAELRRLAAEAPPLTQGVSAPRYQDARLGGWLFDWADRFPHDPLGAIAAPTESSTINPRAAGEADRRFWLGLIGWDTLRTGNLPRWGGQLTPDAILASAGGEAASVARARAAASGAATATRAGAMAARSKVAAHIEDVARQTGGTPVGQEKWVKSQESLTRKILRDMRTKGLTAYEALRDPRYPLEVRQRAHDELVRLSSGLDHPPEIERVGTLKAYRRPDR